MRLKDSSSREINASRFECTTLAEALNKVQADYEKANADILIFETAVAAAQSERGMPLSVYISRLFVYASGEYPS
jgi:hypothetical protein